MLETLKQLIEIQSVYDQATVTKNAPYGANCKRALDWFLKTASDMGMRTANIDNRCGYAEIGEGDQMVCAMAHLDVVDAGFGWSSNPYTLTIENGYLYGRGVADDKGPLIATLFALKDLLNKPLKRRIRLIVGCDEERGSSCMAHYVKSGNEIPVMGFTPDANFPVINCEKNVLQIDACFKSELASEITSISGAPFYNAVPSMAKVGFKLNGTVVKKLKQINGGTLNGDVFTKPPIVNNIITDGHDVKQYSLYINDSECVIEATGAGAHASTPHEGDNALWKIACFLKGVESLVGGTTFTTINDYLCTPLAEDKLGISCSDEDSGELTMSVDMISIKDNKVVLGIDFRYPVVISKEQIISSIQQKTGGVVTNSVHHDCLFVKPSSPLIQTLLDVYRKHFNAPNAKPIVIGGGTYAKEMPNTVAFGPVIDFEPNEHGADENMPVEIFYKLKDVYQDALQRLANL